ncbi:hypothetical protein SAMN02927916_2300 [Flavobacterium anhuiense]|uniref:Lipoprotein n=1 Tax=Flavobacterium anhuiense TaxID=459526 RepID=A0ABY0LQA5_9FLAO|nr:hypothetical protein [Flavobacterium anhuiense]SCY49596.1 hypothetical protein SAMN02927916_2300 [Flavobacterium anhuiense]
MKYYLYLLLLSIILFSCNSKIEKNVILNSHDLSKDTLFSPKNNLLEKKCLDQVKGYKNKYGIILSNYYTDQPIPFDFDNNKTVDTIVVLKPYYESNEENCFPNNSEFDFPILLISKTINKKSEIFKIYKNVLKCNTPVYYEEIKINNSGFIISKDLIGNSGFYTKTYISFNANDFYVDSINVESWGWKQYKKTLKFTETNFPLSNYKRTDIDSIRTLLDNNNQ